MARVSTLRHKSSSPLSLIKRVPVVSFTGRAPCSIPRSVGESLSSCPSNLENVAAFSKFLCPPHLLGSNFPPPFLSVHPVLSPVAPVLGDVLTLPVGLRPPGAVASSRDGNCGRYWGGLPGLRGCFCLGRAITARTAAIGRVILSVEGGMVGRLIKTAGGVWQNHPPETL